ncbi:SGNH/GDSL hydrolase family protein, partial [Candidatus Saccharibacteria bacterium]|nr:SGNH/GDSL hydrolase family protein [Candidatus Saccharibacteria bacterium]
YSQAESVACSGGKIKDVKIDKALEYKNNNPQASGLVEPQYDEEIYTNYLPGYRRQFEFVKKYKPAAVTLSIGGNDINFGKKLQYCILTQYSCYESAEQKQNVLNEVKGQYSRLVETYQGLKAASPDTRIYVVGYPKLVLPGGDCALNVRLSSAELMLAEEITEDLNTVIKRAAENTGVFYVDAANTFSGHRLCENKSWALAVNGLTFGTDAPFSFGPISSATFHPNKLGHQLYKDVILQKTASLTSPMPAPAPATNVKDMPGRLSPTGDTTGTSVQPILEDGLFGDLVQAGTQAVSLLDISGYFLEPDSNYQVEIHSTPVVIGTATATTNQQLAINAVIPVGIEPGPHVVHIFGKNIAGEQIDIYKDVTVIASDTDYDGDGVLNADDKCIFVTPSGIDTDKDGVDDACDSLISEAPAPPPPPPPVDPPTPPISPRAQVIAAIKKLVTFIVGILRLFFRR